MSKNNNVAVWGSDYDGHEDKIYKRPVCPVCKDPFGKYDDGKYYCYGCGNEVIVTDKKMLEWLAKHEETKIEMEDCPDYEFEHKGQTIKMGCGGKACVETRYYRSPITGKWRVAGGKCTKCGRWFIV